jgi:hypothetical protein
MNSLCSCLVCVLECIYLVVNYDSTSYDDINNAWSSERDPDDVRHQAVTSTAVSKAGLPSMKDMTRTWCMRSSKTIGLQWPMLTSPHLTLPRLSLEVTECMIGAASCMSATRRPCS